MSDRKAVIKNADMSEEMQQDAVDCATQALEKYNIEKVYLLFFFLWASIIDNISWESGKERKFWNTIGRRVDIFANRCILSFT